MKIVLDMLSFLKFSPFFSGEYLLFRCGIIWYNVATAWESSNMVARNLYASFGVCETGEVAGNEVEMKLTVSDT